jgi:hypothetical protein
LGVSFRAFNIDFFPIPKNEEVVSHPVRVITVFTLKQHVLRSSYQAQIWLTAHISKPAVGSPLEHGWKDGKFGLEPILFEGQRQLPILPAICSDRYGFVSTFPSDHTALILVFGLDRLNYLCQSILFEKNH